jgi:GNAT superfamily N-acetyltransferase
MVFLNSVNISKAIPADAEALTEIAIAAKGHWDYPAHWMARWRSVLTVTPAFIAAHETYAARSGDRIIGFCALRRDGDDLHLEDLFVLPGEMGRGVGSALFRHAQGRARELGFAFFEVQSDPHAAGFYERMGAERIGTSMTLLDSYRRDLPIFRCRTSGGNDQIG